MKKWLGLITLMILILALVAPACTSPTTTTAPPAAATSKPATSAGPASSAPVNSSPATSAPAATTAKPTASTAPASSATSSQPQSGGTLIWVRNTGIPTIGASPDMPTQTQTFLLVAPVLENLVLTDEQGQIVPWLANSVDTSADGKTITFNLKKGIKFQDGTDFNAQAVKYNLQAVYTAKCSGSAILDNVASYDVVDDYTLKLSLKQYDARLLLGLAQSGIGAMASPTALAKPTTPENAGKDHCVGTGPFLFDSWAKDQYIKFKKWDGYREKGKPYLDAIEFRNNPTVATSLISFKAKEVNMVENIDPSDYNSLKAAGYAVAVPESLAFVFSVVPDSANADSPFAKVQVRQALEYALDKAGMAKGIGLGTQYPAVQLGTSKDPWYIKDYPTRSYDLAKAKQLLADAGYPNGFSYPLISDVRMRQDQTVAIQSYLKEAGMNLTMDVADVARMTSLQSNGWKGLMIPGFPNWDSFSSWTNRFLNPTLTYPSAATPPGWKDGWNKMAATVDFNQRMTMMRDWLKQNYDQAYVIPYIYDSPRYVTDGTVMDMSWDARNTNGYFDPANVWLKKK
jgi:peptide/nickel transport system substrate-binding protein